MPPIGPTYKNDIKWTQSKYFNFVKAIGCQRAHFEIFHRCITPMYSYLFINNIWPEFAKLLDTRPITIHKFYSTGLDCLNKTFFFHLFKIYNVICEFNFCYILTNCVHCKIKVLSAVENFYFESLSKS